MGNPALDYSIPTTHRNTFTLRDPIYRFSTYRQTQKQELHGPMSIKLGPTTYLNFEEALITEYDFPTSATDTSALTISYAGAARSVVVSTTPI